MEIRIRFPSDPMAVRSALGGVREGLSYVRLPADVQGKLELVLAEALNNVVEHAHAGRADGIVEMRVRHDGSDRAPVLTCELIDDGVPMPDGSPAPPPSLEIEADAALLPEGGFGWMLIHELAQDVGYERFEGRNRLRFQLDAAEEAEPGA
jgi:serine/threonine-protein kinase RsbW